MRALPFTPEAQPVPLRRVVTTLCLFSGVTAFAGGLDLLLGSPGSRFLPPLSVLQNTPFSSFIIPGALLAAVVGGTSLLAGVLVWREAKTAPDALIIAGGALTVWIVSEVAMLRAAHGLHFAYGTLGITLLCLGVADAWRTRNPRLRWLVLVTAFEALGFLAPMAVGVLTKSPPLVMAAGLLEGLALGAGQALAFPMRVRRLRYALYSAIGGALAWVCIMGGLQLNLLALTPLGLLTVGGMQWLELRRASWIGWTALAWIVALPFSFLPMPFVDLTTPMGAMAALWACAGLMMAYVMALITWQGAKRLIA